MSFYISHFSKKLPRLPETKNLHVIGYVNEDISGDLEIQSLVEKNERDKKIIELFKAQLLLPINQQSKALMSRFGIDVTKNGQVDAWPTSKVVKFHVNCYFPVDTAVQDAARLAGAKSKVLGLFTEQSTGNTYFFYFPLSMYGVTEDNILKLDHFNTWIYRDTGEPVPDRGDEYNIYHALFDQISNKNIESSNKFLAKLGMYSDASGVTYTLRNHNIRVESMVRNTGNSALNLIEQQPIETPAAPISDDELNAEITPIGDDSDDPFEELARLAGYFTNIASYAGDGDNDISEPVIIPNDTDNGDVSEPNLEVDNDDDFKVEFDQFNNTKGDVELSDIFSKAREGVFPLSEIIANPKYTHMNPFDQLAMKYPDYYIQFNYSAGGYSKLKHVNYVIQHIDKEKKMIEVVVHDTAHHSHRTSTGRSDKEDLFKLYNSEFVSAGNADNAMKNVGDERVQHALKTRMKPFTRNKYVGFRL